MSTMFCKVCNQYHDTSLPFYNVKLEDASIVEALCKKNPELYSELGGSINICKECFFELFYLCENCCEVHVKNEPCDCIAENVLDYMHKQIVIPEYKGSVQFEKLRLGLEIETEFRNSAEYREDTLREFTNILGTGYCKFKRDGSLGRKGIEFVTMPMYFEHYKSMKGRWTKAFKYYRSMGGCSYCTPRTGVHIHLTRDAFVSYKHLYNFYVGITKNQRFSQRISRRKANGYCKFPLNANELAYKTIYENRHYGRYHAVNTNNINTIEVRIYKGNIKWDSVQSYIEHAYSMFEYSLMLTQKNVDFTVEGYRKFVLDNKGKFEELAKII